MTREGVALAFETLLAEGDEACLDWLRSRGSAVVPVELIEGPMDAGDAVALAHGLAELGRTAEAFEVMDAVCAARLNTARGWGATLAIC